jgi:pyridoxal phosphate enzyme (YggS family)
MAFDVSQYQALLRQLPAGVLLLPVSKTKPVSDLMEAYEIGVRSFGENYVQELVDKQQQMPKDIQWHFIGHLQSNKVKYIAPFVHLIHGVDKPSLLDEIQKQAAKNHRQISVLLQVHIAKEETKFGFSQEELSNWCTQFSAEHYPNILFCGVMGMASFDPNPDLIRSEFKSLKRLFDHCSARMGDHWKTISMGMSSDWSIAVEEGSNLLRIGSILFGSRN